MTPEERAAEIERLNRILSASQQAGAGYAKRIEAIKARIAELEADG